MYSPRLNLVNRTWSNRLCHGGHGFLQTCPVPVVCHHVTCHNDKLLWHYQQPELKALRYRRP